jgi:HlyD family secretion protein
MSRHLRWLYWLLLLSAGVAWLVWALQPEPIAVKVTRVEPGLVEKTVANTRAGTINPCRRARLSPSVGGQIARLAVKEGARVKQGDLLLELWNQDLAAEMRLAEQQRAASTATANAVCYTAEVARREADRLSRMAKGITSEERIDQAETSAKARQADCEAARAQAGVSQARVGVNAANLQRTRLQAPFDGVVAEVHGELGEFVTPSPPGIPTLPVVDLLDDSCFYVSAPIDEVDAQGIRTGMTARISLDAFGERSLRGKVRRIACYVLDLEKQARTLEVEAEFSDPEGELGLLAGYSADLEIILEQRIGVLRVPTEAVTGGNQVLLFDPDSQRLRQATVKTGLSNWKYTEIVEGLTGGERVVLSLDKEGVKAGVRVRIEGEAP